VSVAAGIGYYRDLVRARITSEGPSLFLVARQPNNYSTCPRPFEFFPLPLCCFTLPKLNQGPASPARCFMIAAVQIRFEQ